MLNVAIVSHIGNRLNSETENDAGDVGIDWVGEWRIYRVALPEVSEELGPIARREAQDASAAGFRRLIQLGETDLGPVDRNTS